MGRGKVIVLEIMSNSQSTKEDREKAIAFMEMKGDIRGLSLIADYEYVRHKLGDEGVKKVEKKMALLGYPLPLKEIKQMEFYPIGYAGIIELAIERALNFTMEDYYEMGRYAPKSSVILKVMLKYFASLDSAIVQATNIWRKYYTIGILEAIEVNKKERRVVFRISEYEIAPSTCHVIRGYLAQVTQMITGKQITSEERFCTFRGDPYHEIVFTW